MVLSQKHVFWQALIITILVFSLGIISGIVLENWRTSKVDYLYKQSEIDLLDIKLQSEIYSQGNFNCEEAINENINFADRIYKEALILERYEKASQLTEDIKLSHKKYDILRAILFLNSIEIKRQCNASYYEIVYFYKVNDPNIEIKSKESVFSRLLSELKEKKGKDILLIPIAADNNVTSINLLLNKYSVSQNELPVILIDRKIKVRNIENINDLIKYFE